MKKTLGQVYFEGAAVIRGHGHKWVELNPTIQRGWEDAAAKLAADFDSIRSTTNCNDEQTDDSSGVPMNVDTHY